MARYALIRSDDTVDCVIVADPTFFARADPEWLGQFKEWREISSVETVEPDCFFDRKTQRFVPARSVA